MSSSSSASLSADSYNSAATCASRSYQMEEE
jgi:hypothetical protein